jgi:proteasome lid subunit RPN8/RPN11
MAKPAKEKHAALRMSTEVARQIRQHARSSPKAEVCGVLIGEVAEGAALVRASIAGVNAAQGGAHVTFTQDTWEHIYKIKDRDFPDARIVGWYHSHPGFGIFLSDHDTFIHKNFFSAPEQVAWVYDPHSDEEGCFGWHGSRLERVARFSFVDAHGGEPASVPSKVEPGASASNPYDWSDTASPAPRSTDDEFDEAAAKSSDEVNRLAGIVSAVFSHLAVLLIGGLLVWHFLPHYVGVPIPVDPSTGLPLKEYMDRLREILPKGSVPDAPPSPAEPSSTAPQTPPPPAAAPNSNSSTTKGNHAHQ